ncbi:MAG: ZIP family metal transporter [Endomicrobiia bacterium]
MSIIFISLLSGMFTWSLTALGSGIVFLTKKPIRKFIDAGLGFSAGIMLSASIFSLLLPSIQLAEFYKLPKWFPASVGFILGAVFLNIIDNIAPHLHIFEADTKQEGIKTNLKKPMLIFLAMTIHNFPEGIACGVSLATENLIDALILVLAIGLQNFPEGMAISITLNAGGMKKLKSFYYGNISAIVEPIGAVLAVLLVSLFKKILPYALSFASGAMVYVTVEELIPESQKAENTNLATFSLIAGFILMMILDLLF